MALVKRKTSIGWSDPRTVTGALLCPERIGPEELATLKMRLGPYGASGQLQQQPSPAEGGILKRDWWKFYRSADLPPYFDEVVLSFDCAFKDTDGSDYVAGFAMGRLGPNIYLLPQRVLERLDVLGTANAVRLLDAQYHAGAKYIEDKANGPAVIQILRGEIPGLIAVNPEGNKLSRAHAIVPALAGGNIWLPEDAAWAKEFIENAAKFPNASHDDDVDALTQGVVQLLKSMSALFYGEFRPAVRVEDKDPSALHVGECAIQSWWVRWLSIYWSAERTVAHWYASDHDGRVLVYRELVMPRLSAEDAGSRIARMSSEELSSGRKLTAWMDPHHFEAGLNSRTIAQQFALGIEKELAEPVFLYAHTPDETTVGDTDRRRAMLDRRRVASGSRIMLQGATADDPSGPWERARGLMRWWQHERERFEFSRETALELRAGEDGERTYQEYMRLCSEDPAERLPKLKIWPECKALIADLSRLTRDSRDNKIPLLTEGSTTGKIATREAAQSFYFGIAAHCFESVREPADEFVARRLSEVMARKPDLPPERLHLVEMKARGDWQKSRPKSYRFRPLGARRVG